MKIFKQFGYLIGLVTLSIITTIIVQIIVLSGQLNSNNSQEIILDPNLSTADKVDLVNISFQNILETTNAFSYSLLIESLFLLFIILIYLFSLHSPRKS